LIGERERLADRQTPAEHIARLLDTPVAAEVRDRIAAYRARSEAYLDAALG
jgi:hypothetical protein